MSEPQLASVVPFPLYARLAFVRQQADHYLRRPHAEAERYLQQQLDLQATVLRRKQVAEADVIRERSHLERAIRAAVLDLSEVFA